MEKGRTQSRYEPDTWYQSTYLLRLCGLLSLTESPIKETEKPAYTAATGKPIILLECATQCIDVTISHFVGVTIKREGGGCCRQ